MTFNSYDTTEVAKVFSFEENLFIILEYGTLNVMTVHAWPYFKLRVNDVCTEEMHC